MTYVRLRYRMRTIAVFVLRMRVWGESDVETCVILRILFRICTHKST